MNEEETIQSIIYKFAIACIAVIFYIYIIHTFFMKKHDTDEDKNPIEIVEQELKQKSNGSDMQEKLYGRISNI